jgi:hypothetical protein
MGIGPFQLVQDVQPPCGGLRFNSSKVQRKTDLRGSSTFREFSKCEALQSFSVFGECIIDVIFSPPWRPTRSAKKRNHLLTQGARDTESVQNVQPLCSVQNVIGDIRFHRFQQFQRCAHPRPPRLRPFIMGIGPFQSFQSLKGLRMLPEFRCFGNSRNVEMSFAR